jgi:hypothetical protein
MGLSARKKVILAKIESVYGTDSTPSGTDAMLVTALDVSPMEAETVERNLFRSYYGQAERLMSQIFSKASFEVELGGHGAGVVGAKPKIDELIRACGFSGSQKTISVTGITRSSSTATATIGSHSYEVGDKIFISGADQSEYNGMHTITAVGATTIQFAVSGTPVSPATGTMLMNSAYEYTPISESIPSITIYHNIDGVLHKLTGCKGTFSLDLSVKTIPKLKFEFTGLNNDPTDTAAPSVSFDDFLIPQVANTQNTTGFSLLGFSSGALESLNFALNNVVNYVTLIGKQYVEVLDRKANGSMSFEAPTIAAKDFWSAAKDQDTGTLAILHGSKNGNKVSLSCPRVMLDSPKYKEANGVMMMTCGVSIMPDDGDDEIVFQFK